MIKRGDMVISNDGRQGEVLSIIFHDIYKYVVNVNGQWHYFKEDEVRKVDEEC